MKAQQLAIANALLNSSREGIAHENFKLGTKAESLMLGALNGIGAVEVGAGEAKAKSDAPDEVTADDIFDGLVNLGSPELTASMAAAFGINPLLTLGAAHTRLGNPHLEKVTGIIESLGLDADLEALADFLSSAVEKLLVTSDIGFTFESLARFVADEFPDAVNADWTFEVRKACVLNDAALLAARELIRE